MMGRLSVSLLVFILFTIIGINEAIRNNPYEKECTGTSLGVSHTDPGNNKRKRYDEYVKHYQNCTIITSNLEITYVKLDETVSNETYDMSFLNSIEEVYGYVLITGNEFDDVPLTSLRVIHGRHLWPGRNGNYSLFIYHNTRPNSSIPVGLKQVQLNSLQEIVRGDVLFGGNNHLCHIDTIQWSDVLVNNQSRAHITKSHCTSKCSIGCYQNTTGMSHCWTSGDENCQQFHRSNCSKYCNSHCFGSDPSQCCDATCAGGCLQDSKNCWTCRSFENDGKCVSKCPRLEDYDTENQRWVPDPNGRYYHKHKCVKTCPANMYVKGSACVTECGEGYVRDESGSNQCIACNNACPKNCTGGEITSANIQNYINCTIIKGPLQFLPPSFEGRKKKNLAPLNISDLQVFENVIEITEYLQVQGSGADLKSLSFLKNLKTILGHKLKSGCALQVGMTKLEILGLTSLETIGNGNVLITMNSELEEIDLVSLKRFPSEVMITSNPRLCYYRSIDWESKGVTLAQNNNSNATWCEQENRTCDVECEGGCWGRSDAQCVGCRGWRLERRCLRSCDSLPNLYQIRDSKECQRCHQQCAGGCTGQNADECFNCSNVKDGRYCKPSCPVSKYPDNQNICQDCSPVCKDGCTGPNTHLGKGGCRACHLYLELGGGEYECLGQNVTCPPRHYVWDILLPEGTVEGHGPVKGCRRCHEECVRCNVPGDECLECKNYRQGWQCVSECSSNHYLDLAERQCRPCDGRCMRCRGSSNLDCLSCKGHKIYASLVPQSTHSYDDSREISPDQSGRDRTSVRTEVFSESRHNGTYLEEMFYCEDECPSWAPAKMPETKNNITETLCVTEAIRDAFLGSEGGRYNKSQKDAMIGVGVVSLLVALVVCSLLMAHRIQLKRKREREEKTAQLLGIRLLQECSPSQHDPDRSKLNVMNESELSRGAIIGSGAFGTVYKGIWIPTGEKLKIPVAIKVLQDGASVSELSSELLDEARVMAAVRHENCIRILGVCLTAQLMLVTQLMPNGSLLDYIRKYRDRIGSNAILTWCKQIAQGMQYLEDLGIVHRDLAARNVLVEGPQSVKITDFGLAKLVKGSEEYQATGGKLPIKWLALESIQHRVFTHKSDVWSYGVTLWEIFTYGQRPYDNVPAKNLCDVLERGERLPQPDICTIDVYMILIKCWMVDDLCRPSFKDLVETFSSFSNDPGRYLVVQQEDRMQLPSSEEKLMEMLRGLSVLEDDEGGQVTSADEYLRPHDLIIDHLAMRNQQGVDYSNTSDGFTSPMTYKNLSDLEGGSTQKGKETEKGKETVDRKDSQRYSTHIPSHTSVKPVIKNNSYIGAGENKPAGVETKRKLLEDEDDYLQPVPSKPHQYVDFTTPNTGQISRDAGGLDYINTQSLTSAGRDNPEYFQYNTKML